MTTHTHTPVLLAACLALLAAPAAAQWAGAASPHRSSLKAIKGVYGQSRGPEQTEQILKSFKPGGRGILDLTNLSGDVKITGGTGDEIRVEAVKRWRPGRRADSTGAKSQLASVQVQMTERAGRVEVKTIYPGRDTQVSVDYVVAMPSGGSAYVNSVSGDVVISGVKGEVSVEVVSGDVRAARAGRLVHLKTMSGDAILESAEPGAEAHLTAISGDIWLRGLKLRSAELSTVSGDIQLVDLTCERVSAKSVNGDIQYSGALARGGRYEFRSHAGDVRLALADGVGFEIEATTFSGDINTQLPITMRAGAEGDPRHRMRRTLAGTLGDGAAFISINTFNGDIVLTRR